MKLTEILSGNANVAEWESKGYELPKYDIAAVAKKTHDEPTWVHFGAGNIFRAFPAAILNDALNTGKYDRGVIVAESFDYEIIDKAYRPYGNLSLLVSLQSSGTIENGEVAHPAGAHHGKRRYRDRVCRERLVERRGEPEAKPRGGAATRACARCERERERERGEERRRPFGKRTPKVVRGIPGRNRRRADRDASREEPPRFTGPSAKAGSRNLERQDCEHENRKDDRKPRKKRPLERKERLEEGSGDEIRRRHLVREVARLARRGGAVEQIREDVRRDGGERVVPAHERASAAQAEGEARLRGVVETREKGFAAGADEKRGDDGDGRREQGDGRLFARDCGHGTVLR